MQKLAGENFPDNICEILVAAGFDSKTAIKSFVNPTIFPVIENYVNENPLKFAEILKGTKYEHSTPFKFLPGHIALLSNLPEYLQKLNTKKQVKVKNSCRENTNQFTNSEQSNNLADNNENSEVNDEQDLNIKNKLRQALLKKINNFSTKKNIGVEFADENITNFRFENQTYKCVVQCPKCNRPVPCNYTSFWTCSNLQAHLKTHIIVENNVETYEVDENNRLAQIDKRNGLIVRIADTHELNSILGA